MNVRLQYDLEFLAGIYYDGRLQFNSYSVCVGLLTLTPDAVSSNIALERIKCFVYQDLADTVFFGPDDQEKAEMFHMLGANVTTLPNAPIDQIVGIMLYCKLNAIMEQRMIITGLDISSTIGDSVWYQHDDEDDIGTFATESAWWHSSSAQHHTVDTEPVPDNVVKVMPSAWQEYDLLWPEERTEMLPTGSSVIYPDFRKNETK